VFNVFNVFNEFHEWVAPLIDTIPTHAQTHLCWHFSLFNFLIIGFVSVLGFNGQGQIDSCCVLNTLMCPMVLKIKSLGAVPCPGNVWVYI